jgi:hypothetical protein
LVVCREKARIDHGAKATARTFEKARSRSKYVTSFKGAKGACLKTRGADQCSGGRVPPHISLGLSAVGPRWSGHFSHSLHSLPQPATSVERNAHSQPTICLSSFGGCSAAARQAGVKRVGSVLRASAGRAEPHKSTQQHHTNTNQTRPQQR